MMKVSKTTLLLLAALGLFVLAGAAMATADPGNEDWQTATELFDGENSQHAVAAGGGGNPADEDWYKVMLTEGQVLQIGIIFDASSGWLCVNVFGPDGIGETIFAEGNNQDQINAQEVDLFIFANGTYYIRVYVFDGDSCQYLILLRVVTPPVLTSGVQVTNPNPLMGRVISSMWYRIWLKGGNETVDQAEAQMTWTNPTNTHLYVMDRKSRQALNILNYSVSRDQDHAEDCRWAASYTGYYYVRVVTSTLYEDESLGVTFQLRATILGTKYRTDGNVQQSDAKLVPVRQTFNGKINQAYDTHDWYKFYLNKGEMLSAKATITDAHLAEYWDYFNLTLYTWNGTILVGGHNMGTTGAPISACSFTLSQAPYTGLYFLSFSAWYTYSGSGQTDYTNGKLVNSCRYELDVLVPNRRVWIIAPPDEVRMDEDSEKTIILRDVFWDPEGDPLIYGTIGGGTNFTLQLSMSEGTLVIRPNENWYGTEKITLWAHDGRPDQRNSTVITIVVKSVPDPPVVRRDAPTIIYIWEDEINTTALNLNTAFADVDIEDKFLVFSADQNEHVNIELEQTSGRVTLYGAVNYNGEQELTFYAADTYNFRVSHSIKVVVRPVNDAPVAVGKIARQSIDEGTKSHIDVLDFFEDIDGDSLYYYAEWDQEGKIAFDNLDSDPLNSWFDIYPEDPNFYGFVQVVFVVYDRDKLNPDYDDERYEARQSAIWEVKNVNDAPRLDAWTPDYNPEIQELEEQTFTIVSIYDVDSTTFRYKWFVDDVEQVEWAGSFYTYTTSYESAGAYRIRCEVKDNLGEPANTMPEWTLTIKNTNRDPTVNLRTRDSTLDEGERITLQADGYDQDGDSLTYTWYEVAPDGREREVGLGANFQMKTPLAAGVYKYKCQVDDGNSKQWSDEVLVTVTAKEFPAVLPGFGTFGAIAALGAAVGAAMLVRPRRR